MSQQETPSKSPIAQSESLAAYFHTELERIHTELGLTTSAHTRAYLVSLLDSYTRLSPQAKPELGFERPAAFMLSDAVHGAPGQRIDAYRRLGDACLYNCGFFSQKLTRRSVSASYYEAMGRNAYDHAHDLMRGSARQASPFGQIFAELSDKFAGVVRALKRLGQSQDPMQELEELFARIERGEQVKIPGLIG